MGGDNENGKFNSFLITFLFNLVGTGYSSVDMKVKKYYKPIIYKK